MYVRWEVVLCIFQVSEVVLCVFQVRLADGVEVWLGKLRDSVGHTLKELNVSVINDCSNGIAMEEWAYKVGRRGICFRLHF